MKRKERDPVCWLLPNALKGLAELGTDSGLPCEWHKLNYLHCCCHLLGSE